MWGILLALAIHGQASATTYKAAQEAIWDVHAQKFITLEELQAQAGDTFIFGEEHATTDNAGDPEVFIHHDNQLRLIQHFQKAAAVSVGMEFLTYTLQSVVDAFLNGSLPETDFLKQEGWNSGNPFDFYRRQILAAAGTPGRTIALNIPEHIANEVAENGKDSLPAADKALTPPFWERGNDQYFARFQEAMGGHVSVTDLENFFWAQSLWDDTMAWRTLQFRLSAPRDVMVIIVGEFHVQFGGGLPYELKKNGGQQVKTVLQIATPDWQPATLQQAVQADPTYGDSADYLWLHTGQIAEP